MYVLHFVLFTFALLAHRIGSSLVKSLFSLKKCNNLFSVETVNLNPQLRYEACIPTVNCSWFQSDDHVILLLPFTWSLEHSHATEVDGRVITLSILREDEIPLITYCFRNLNRLIVSESNIDRLPPEIRFLSSLNYINLYDNKDFSHVADEIGELTELRSLRISKSKKLKYLPAEIGKLTNLIDLSITDCGLEDVPGSIRNLQHLESIDFSGNSLAGLPHNMRGLTSARSLKLSFNRNMSSLQEIIALANLRELYIIDCGFKELPSVITSMIMLEILDLGANELTSLPYTIGQLTNLHSLYLGGNRFTSIPRELALLNSLTTLYMDGNGLIDISAVGLLKQIRYLNFSRN
jgi:Leucine-rich repeat (LRR) protein